MGLGDKIKKIFYGNKDTQKVEENNDQKINDNNQNTQYQSRVHRIKRQYNGEDGKPHYDTITLIYQGEEGLVMETGGIKQVPVYRLTVPEIDNGQNINGIKVYAEIDEERLSDPNDKYQEWVAQTLFSKDRTKKIFEQYNGYAGGLNIDSNGDLCRDQFGKTKYIDLQVISALEYKKEQDWNQVRQVVRSVREDLQSARTGNEYPELE